MARHTSRAKAGFYAFPDQHIEALLSLVAPATPQHKLLDPMAGEGAIAEAMGNAWKLTVYTNELDKTRARACVSRFGAHAIQGDVETLEASNNAFAVLWANPPYDVDKTEDGESKRVEYKLLRHSWKWLQDGGLGFWIVYHHHLTDAAVRFFAENCSHVDVWALPGKHLQVYDQIIVIGVKGRYFNPDQLFDAIKAKHAAPRLLDVQEKPIYRLPSPASVRLFSIAPRTIDEETGARYIADQGAWKSPRFQELLSTATQKERVIESVLPPRPGHTTIVLAAGFADGAVIQSEAYGAVAIRGKTVTVEKEKVTSKSDGDPDHPTVHITKRLTPTSTIAVVSEKGDVVQFNDDSAMIKFITDHRQQLTRYIAERFNPIYQFDLNGMHPFLDSIRLNGKYPLYNAQKHVVAATVKGFEQRDGILLVGQMGTGKTVLGSSSAVALGTGIARAMRGKMRSDQVVLIVCPPHLARKWEREARSISPRTYIEQIKRHEDVKAFMDKAARMDSGIAKIGIIKRDMTKLGSGRSSAVVWRKRHDTRWRHDEPRPPQFPEPTPRIVSELVPTCPTCGRIVADGPSDDRKPMSKHALNSGKRICSTCATPLWQEKRDSSSQPRPGEKYPRANPRYRIDEYIKRKYPDRVALLIWDEAHEAQHGDTGNGEAFGRMANFANKVLAMTGTPFNGRASSLFNLEYHLNPRVRKQYAWGGAPRFSRKRRNHHIGQTRLAQWQKIASAADLGYPEMDFFNTQQRGDAESRWVDDMGVREGGEDHVPQYDRETGEYTGTTTYDRPYVEAPGISPLCVAEVLDHTIFFSLTDMSEALPEYREEVVMVDLDDDVLKAHNETEANLKDHLLDMLLNCSDNTFRGAYFHWCIDWINSAFLPYDVIHNFRDKGTREIQPKEVKKLPSMGLNRIYAKEAKLLEIVGAELDARRPCIVFCRQTNKRDIQGRLKQLIEARTPLAKVFILGSKVDADRREAVIEAAVQRGHNVIIANPELIKTGLDLVFAGTLIFFEPIYNLGTMMQAAGRNYRLNQKAHKLCRVIYLIYNGTMEAKAIQLMSKKQRAAKILLGDTGLTGLEALTEGEGGLQEALLSQVGESTELVDPSTLFKAYDETKIIDRDDLSFWNVAIAAPETTAAIEVEPSLLKTAAALGATITPLAAKTPDSPDILPDLFQARKAATPPALPETPPLIIVPKRATALRDVVRAALAPCLPASATTKQQLDHDTHIKSLTHVIERFIAETPIFWEDGSEALLIRDIRKHLMTQRIAALAEAVQISQKIITELKPAALDDAKRRVPSKRTASPAKSPNASLDTPLSAAVQRFQQRAPTHHPEAVETFTQLSMFG